ncbi:uncharacterized protein K460DRAFT_254644, partial [Cucurbitaria berberidis CBS 394.84]
SASVRFGWRVLVLIGIRQNLQGWMIFFIVISAVIGTGIFSNGGSSVEIAGPGGALFALVIMGE